MLLALGLCFRELEGEKERKGTEEEVKGGGSERSEGWMCMGRSADERVAREEKAEGGGWLLGCFLPSFQI